LRYICEQHIPDFEVFLTVDPEFDMALFFFTQPITAHLAVYTDLSQTQLMDGHCQPLHIFVDETNNSRIKSTRVHCT